MSSLITVDQFIAELREWEKTPFAHGQACKGVGVDCLGLILGSLNTLDVFEFGRRRDYAPMPDGTMPGVIEKLCHPSESPIIGDLLIFNTPDNPDHLAICTGRNSMIHAWSGVGFVCESGIDQKWLKRLHSVWAWPWSDGGEHGD